jgi:antitoxin HicB
VSYAYPVNLDVRPEGVAVGVPDLPEVVSVGADMATAMDHAQLAIEVAVTSRVRKGERVPLPSVARGRPVVHLRAITQAKLALHTAMLEMGVSDLELAARLGSPGRSVTRLRDPGQDSAVNRVEAALRSLGRRLVVSMTDAGG